MMLMTMIMRANCAILARGGEGGGSTKRTCVVDGCLLYCFTRKDFHHDFDHVIFSIVIFKVC